MVGSRSLDCPVCETRLKEQTKHGVVIDYCPNCGGVWLDPGELKQVAHHDRDVDLDIGDEAEFEEDEFEEGGFEEAEDDGGILGTIAGALAGGEEEVEAEGEFEEAGGFAEEGFEEGGVEEE